MFLSQWLSGSNGSETEGFLYRQGLKKQNTQDLAGLWKCQINKSHDWCVISRRDQNCQGCPKEVAFGTTTKINRRNVWAKDLGKEGFLTRELLPDYYSPLQGIPWAWLGCRQCLSGLQRQDRRMRTWRQSPCPVTCKHSQRHNREWINIHLPRGSLVSFLARGVVCRTKELHNTGRKCCASLTRSQWKMTADKCKVEPDLSINHWEKVFWCEDGGESTCFQNHLMSWNTGSACATFLLRPN